MKKSLAILYLFFALALVFSPVTGYAQKPADKKAPPAAPAMEHGGHQHGAMGEGASKMGGEDRAKMMEEHRKEMMAKHDEAVAAMKAMDEALDAKIAAMKAAKGDEKMAAMEGVIELMATQRKEMQAKMADMHHAGMCCKMMGGKMMGGKMMGPGGMKGMGDMSSMCPMMKGMQHGAQPQAGEEKVKQ